ncbi:MAG: outer membrane beta-barrel protein [Bacteroidetes bacterium]|nr:outer membrane beta-barrel protein [Bacteroidota bacterium]
MKTSFLICIFCFLQLIVSAQNSQISGRVLDENNSPVPYVSVLLKNLTDSILLKGELTNESGEFVFQNLTAGSFFIVIKSPGYLPFESESIVLSGVNKNDAGNIILKNSVKDLKAVTIDAERPFIEREADKLVVNVENSIINTGSSVLEVFEKLPGVLVDQDGNIRIRGKQGVIVVIDGKPSALSGQDLLNMLRGMSSSNVQKIEIITNPSAKWDASGSSGVLNIIMKKNKLNGYNGSLSFNYGQGRYPKITPSLSLNYKKDKLNLFFNYSYSDRKGFNNLLINRKFYTDGMLNETFLTNNYILMKFSTHNPRIGLDYSISKKTTVSFLVSGLRNIFKSETDNHTNIFDSANTIVSNLQFSQQSEFESKNYEINSQINHNIDTLGQNLIINLDFGSYNNNSIQNFSTLRTDFTSNTSEIFRLYSDQKGELELYSAKVDYSKPLKNDFNLEAGIKSSLVKSDKDMKFFNQGNNSELFDSSRSSHFIYDENINAAYLSIKRKFKSLIVQVGLRAEQTLATGIQKLNNVSFDRDYFQIFPTVYLDYTTGKHNINMNLGRRINRPAYEQMNPFKRLIDFTTYSEGNPYLSPELTYVSELSYSYDNTYFVVFNYNRTTDNITDVLIQDAASRTTIQSVVNLYEVNYFGIDLTYSKRISKLWKTNINFQGFDFNFAGTVNNFKIDQGEPTFAFNCDNSLTITQNTSAELGIRFNYKNLYGVTLMRNSWNLSAGVKQFVFQKRGSITLNVTDAFWKSYPRGLTQFGDVTEDWTSIRDTRVVNLGITYNFGKGKAGRMRRNTGADEEKQRI